MLVFDSNDSFACKHVIGQATHCASSILEWATTIYDWQPAVWVCFHVDKHWRSDNVLFSKQTATSSLKSGSIVWWAVASPSTEFVTVFLCNWLPDRKPDNYYLIKTLLHTNTEAQLSCVSKIGSENRRQSTPNTVSTNTLLSFVNFSLCAALKSSMTKNLKLNQRKKIPRGRLTTDYMFL